MQRFVVVTMETETGQRTNHRVEAVDAYAARAPYEFQNILGVFTELEWEGEYIAAGHQVMIEQRAKGVDKYGVTLEDAQLSVAELITHAQQEMADGLVYTSALQAAHKRERQQDRNNLVNEVLAILDSPLAMDIKREQIHALAHNPPAWYRFYVQGDGIRELQGVGKNLLTISMTKQFPFLKAIKVQL